MDISKKKYRLCWLDKDKRKVILAVCDSRKQCQKVIDERLSTWHKIIGRDISSEVFIEAYRIITIEEVII